MSRPEVARLIAKTDPGMMPSEYLQRMEALVARFEDCFRPDFTIGDGTDGKRHVVRIKLRPDAIPVSRKPFRLPREHTILVQDWVRRNIQLGRMRLLRMDELEGWSATTFVVPKPNGDFRRVTDYRGLNTYILDSAYFTPDSRFSLEQIADNCVFSEFDCVDGFWNVRIDERNYKYLATRIERIRIVSYTVLPMGLKVSSSEYQYVMDVTFSGIDVGQETHYVDDLRLHCPSFAAHLRVLEQVLSASHGVLTWKAWKCRLLTLETSLLGRLCSSTGIRLDPAHLQARVVFPRPQTLKAVRSFCEIAN